MLIDSLIETPAQYLANAFAEHAVAWAKEAGAPERSLELLRRTAWLTSMGASEGDVCIALADLSSPHSELSIPELRRLLLDSNVVGTSDAPGNLPLVVDNNGRIYLHRYFDHERRLANRLITARSAAGVNDALPASLDSLFGPSTPDAEADWQKIATALALQQRLTIISGGPGTGKTTTVANLLACLLEQDPGTRIALAAPTGKAAARMLEAIRSRSVHLPERLQSILPSESYTIHRLLGVTPTPGVFRHHAGNPLPLDALVVDEASMLDMSLAASLFDAIPASARIILLGDKDQLSAVEAGAVFSDISADPTLSPTCIAALSHLTGIALSQIVPPAPIQPNSLHDSVVWLTRSYRFAAESGIGRLASDINHGRMEQAISWLHDGKDADIDWIEDSGKLPESGTLQRMLDGYTDYVSLLHGGTTDLSLLFAAFDRFRILCAVREGARGVTEINRQITRAFRQIIASPGDRDLRSAWHTGRPVMVTRNDYALKLFNGDIGITMPDESGKLMVYFPDGTGFRSIPPARLPEHETAFAMTVHKSQGSEFDSVLLLLPARPGFAVTRELLYTAVTRSRRRMVLVGGRDVLEQAIATQAQRRSGLIDRLREAEDHIATPSTPI